MKCFVIRRSAIAHHVVALLLVAGVVPWANRPSFARLKKRRRAALYYHPVEVGTYQLELMALIDGQYLRTPFYGSRRMTVYLREQGHLVNRKRVKRLMQLMGLEAIYQRPRTRPASARASRLSVPVARAEHRADQPGVGRRHLLHPDGARLSLSGGGDGLG